MQDGDPHVNVALETIRKKIPIVPDPATAPDPAYRRPTHKKIHAGDSEHMEKGQLSLIIDLLKSGDFSSYVWWCPPNVMFIGLSTP
jgi:hypothetical protein